MPKELLINVSRGEECRIAVLDDGRLEELYMERVSSATHVGNIYKGRVTNVESSIQAAFVDFGVGRNGFLHVQDLHPQYMGKAGREIRETVGNKLGRRDRPPIQQCLRRGDEILVQVIKEGIGTKGPTLTSYLSVPGRYLVMMPGVGKMGVSQKIEDDAERRRLRQILDGLQPPNDLGFIIRTAGVGKTKAELERDFKYLVRLWEDLQKKNKGKPPVELYAEGDLVTRTVRDVYTSDIERILVDDADVAERIKEFFRLSMPRTKNKVDLYQDRVPMFHKYGIEHEIEQMHGRTVPLRSGGSLVIDQTEAVVAIDVNSGKFRVHNDAEETAFRTDMEAAEEIARQLRLRDVGGIVICDFIDLRYDRHRRALHDHLAELLKQDRAKSRFLPMSEFGIVEITRQRMRPSLKKSVYMECPECRGTGFVKTPESMGLDIMRRLAIAANDERVVRIDISMCADVAMDLLNRKRRGVADLESESAKRIVVKVDSQLALDETRIDLYDDRDGLIFLEELDMTPDARAARGRRSHETRRKPQGESRGTNGRGRPAEIEYQSPVAEFDAADDDALDPSEDRRHRTIGRSEREISTTELDGDPQDPIGRMDEDSRDPRDSRHDTPVRHSEGTSGSAAGHAEAEGERSETGPRARASNEGGPSEGASSETGRRRRRRRRRRGGGHANEHVNGPANGPADGVADGRQGRTVGEDVLRSPDETRHPDDHPDADPIEPDTGYADPDAQTPDARHSASFDAHDVERDGIWDEAPSHPGVEPDTTDPAAATSDSTSSDAAASDVATRDPTTPDAPRRRRRRRGGRRHRRRRERDATTLHDDARESTTPDAESQTASDADDVDDSVDSTDPLDAEADPTADSPQTPHEAIPPEAISPEGSDEPAKPVKPARQRRARSAAGTTPRANANRAAAEKVTVSATADPTEVPDDATAKPTRRRPRKPAATTGTANPVGRSSESPTDGKPADDETKPKRRAPSNRKPADTGDKPGGRKKATTAATRKPPVTSPAVTPPPVVTTGSTDRHLLDADEPSTETAAGVDELDALVTTDRVVAAPPKTYDEPEGRYADFDAIPDDYDD